MTTLDHPTAATTAATTAGLARPSAALPGEPSTGEDSGEDGSLVSEYGLIAVLGATITGVAISWAKGGAIATLLNVILRQVRALAGV